MKKSLLIRILCKHFLFTKNELVGMSRKELYQLYKDLSCLEGVYGNIVSLYND